MRVKLRHYRRYLQTEAKLDDSPLYVFDSAFGERAPQMLGDYAVPPYFREDLLGLVGKRRPPFRWIILGPRFSGSGIHIDPLGTSAWNMLMCGRKRWVLFTPDLPEDLVKLPRGHGREAAIWFDKQLPKLKEQGVPMIDFIQVSKNDEFCIKTRNFVSKTRNCAFQMMNVCRIPERQSSCRAVGGM